MPLVEDIAGSSRPPVPGVVAKDAPAGDRQPPAVSSVGSRIIARLRFLPHSLRRLASLVRLGRSLERLRTANGRIKHQNLLLDAALENMEHGLAMFDSDERIVMANSRFAQIYGLTREQTKPGTTLRQIVDLRLASGIYGNVSKDQWLAMARKRISLPTASNVVRKLADGRAVAVTVHPRGDGGWVTTHQDVTERENLSMRLAQQNQLLKQREQQLEAQQARFSMAIDHMSHGLCLFDASQRIVFANRRYAELYHLSPEALKPGTALRDVLEARVSTGLFGTIDTKTFVRNGLASFSQDVSQILRLSDGRFISVVRHPLPDGGVISTHEDVTEREHLKAEIEAQNERVDAALKNMSHGLCMFDGDQRVVIANKGYADIYGLTAEEVKPGTSLRAIVQRRIANGLYAGPNPEHYIEERLAAFNEASRAIHKLSDGRAISINRRPMRGGGWVTTHEDITEREKLKTQLEQQNQQLDVALNNMMQGLAMFDSEQRLIFCNDLYCEMYGLAPDELGPGMTVRQILELRAARGCYKVQSAGDLIDRLVGQFGEVRHEMQQLADGRIFKVSSRKAADGCTVFTHEDISERERLTIELERNNQLLIQRTQRLQALVDNFPGGISVLDGDLRLVVCNDQFKRLLEFPNSLFANGPPSLEELFRFNAARGEYGEGDQDQQVADRLALARQRQAHVFERKRPDGTVLEVRGVPIDDGGFVTTYMDITERCRSEAKIAHMALHDTLTGLPNRVLLNERLEQALTRVKRGELLALQLLDLDHFKTVNDTLGHPAGDKLLELVAERLRSLTRETDTIARMGGDEFAILQIGIGQPADATTLASRVIEEVSKPYDVEGHQVIIGTSVGIAMGPADGVVPEQLIRNADLAMYRAKSAGRSAYRFFEPEMDSQMQARRATEYDLRNALTAGEFELHYQPVVNLASNEISGFEALIRWRHPVRGLVPPGDFIPLAEEIGFIVPIGEWVIRQACKVAAAWPAPFKIAVNLSAAQFRNPGLVQVVVGALASSGLAAERLEVEITETTLLSDSEATLSILYQLRDLGVRIAVDDFGTGYSSLSYLQSFPFDKIKIDRSFVKNIADGVGSLNIVRAVAALASGLGMETTAEGVETSAQLESIRAEGCTEMQGFLFSKALPEAELKGLFVNNRLTPDAVRAA